MIIIIIMRHTNKERRKMTHDRRNGTTKSRQNENAWRKGSIQILGYIGSWRHQTGRDGRKY